MVTNRKVTGKAASIPGGIAAGLAVSLVITLLGCGLLAYLILGEKLAIGSIGYGSIIILALASAAGSWIAGTMTKSRREIVPLLFALSYYLVLLAVTAMFFGGEFQGMGTTAIVVLLSSCAVLLRNLKGNKLPKAGRKIRPYR